MTTARQTRQTPKKKERFLEALCSTGNVSEAAAAADLHRTFVYQLRKDDPDFAAAWDDALDAAADVMEREAFRRAVEGTEKPVFGSLGFRMGTGEVGRIREYSDTLLIFLLKGARPEKYRETTRNLNINLTPEQAKDMTDEELDAELKKRGLL